MTKNTSQNKRETKGENKRMLWADVIRVVAIFLVVLDHNNVISQSASFGNQVTGYGISSVARLGVPLFVVLSGALLLTRETSYKSFFKKRIAKVLIPWISWACVYTVWFFYTRDISFDLVSVVRLFYQTFFGQFWYLWMLWGLYLLTPILWRFIRSSKSSDILYLLGLWFVFASLIPFVSHLISRYSLVSQAYVLLHIGFYVFGYYVLSFYKNVSKFVLSIVLFASLFIQSAGLWYSDQLVPQVKFLNTNLSVFIVFASVSLFLLLFQLLEKKRYDMSRLSHRILSYLSGASFFVFLSHGIMMEVLRSIQGLLMFQENRSFFFVIGVNTFIVIMFCILLYMVLRKVVFLKSVFGAKRF